MLLKIWWWFSGKRGLRGECRDVSETVRDAARKELRRTQGLGKIQPTPKASSTNCSAQFLRPGMMLDQPKTYDLLATDSGFISMRTAAMTLWPSG